MLSHHYCGGEWEGGGGGVLVIGERVLFNGLSVSACFGGC